MAHDTKIRRFLKARGSTQNEAADAIGMSRATFSLKASGFTARDRQRLAEYYDVPLDEIDALFERGE